MFQTPATSNLTEFRTAHEWRLRNLIEISFSNNIFHLSGQLELSRAGRRCLDVCMGKFIVGLKLMVAREGLPPSRPPDGFAGKLQVVDVMERPVEMQKIIMGSNSLSIF